MTVASIAFTICAVLFFVFAATEGEVGLNVVGFIFLGVDVFCLLQIIISYIATFKGVTQKWANTLLIAFSALLCFALIGIVPVIGGAYGIRDINDPQRAEERRNKPQSGFALRLISAILFSAAALIMIIMSVIIYHEIHSSSFMDWISGRYGSEYLQNDGTVELISDKQYDSWDSIEFSPSEEHVTARIHYRIVTAIEPDYEGDSDYEGETKYKTEYKTDDYSFLSEDVTAKTATFKNESGETFMFSYSSWETYSRYTELGGMYYEGDDMVLIIILAFAVFAALIGILQFVGAFAGKKHVWGNMMCIVTGAITSPAIIGIFALMGGIRGNKRLKPSKPKVEPKAETVQTEPSAPAENIATKTLADYPADYENKPTISQVLDGENSKNIVLTNEDGETAEFRQLYVTVYQDELYFVAETVDLSEEEGGGAVVFKVNYENDSFSLETDNSICEALWKEYQTATSSAQFEKQHIKRSDFKLDLYDVNVDEKTWKDFKKTATQEELTVLAIGAKYRMAHSRLKNIIYVLGIILSIVLFWPTGGWSLIGYPIFAFLATKSIRYEDTFTQSYRKLSKENKAYVDGFYKSNIGLKILDVIINMVLIYITLPYQALMLLIGMWAPNFVISKNGILVSLPNGYDVGNLGTVGAYYASFSFEDLIDETLENTKGSGKKEKTFKDAYGNEVEVDEQSYVINDRSEKVYKDKYGNEYISDDGGKTVHKRNDEDSE